MAVFLVYFPKLLLFTEGRQLAYHPEPMRFIEACYRSDLKELGDVAYVAADAIDERLVMKELEAIRVRPRYMIYPCDIQGSKIPVFENHTVADEACAALSLIGNIYGYPQGIFGPRSGRWNRYKDPNLGLCLWQKETALPGKPYLKVFAHNLEASLTLINLTMDSWSLLLPGCTHHGPISRFIDIEDLTSGRAMEQRSMRLRRRYNQSIEPLFIPSGFPLMIQGGLAIITMIQPLPAQMVPTKSEVDLLVQDNGRSRPWAHLLMALTASLDHYLIDVRRLRKLGRYLVSPKENADFDLKKGLEPDRLVRHSIRSTYSDKAWCALLGLHEEQGFINKLEELADYDEVMEPSEKAMTLGCKLYICSCILFEYAYQCLRIMEQMLYEASYTPLTTLSLPSVKYMRQKLARCRKRAVHLRACLEKNERHMVRYMQLPTLSREDHPAKYPVLTQALEVNPAAALQPAPPKDEWNVPAWMQKMAVFTE
ncbi:hypothetical protein F4780DRAFT_789121 [Xylariomycetidae sp. FL0641]|nr:hypothetical protein F4780DRAFT_789121 [Xylariomycetidae sp. FL0641]